MLRDTIPGDSNELLQPRNLGFLSAHHTKPLPTLSMPTREVQQCKQTLSTPVKPHYVPPCASFPACKFFTTNRLPTAVFGS